MAEAAVMAAGAVEAAAATQDKPALGSPTYPACDARHARRSARAAISPAESSASATGVAEVAGQADAAAVKSAPNVICVKP